MLYDVELGNHDEDALDLRVSNAEREGVIEHLRAQVAEGRLTLDEFSERMTEVYNARTQRELEQSLRHLPKPQPAPDRTAEREERRRRWEKKRKEFAGFLMPNVICISIWAMTSPDGYFWPAWVLFGTGVGYVGRLVSGETKEQHRQRKIEQHRTQIDAHGHRHGLGARLGERPQIPAPTPEDTTERAVTTVLFVDIVGSTERAVALGDAAWRDVLDQHDDMVSKQLDRWQGRKIFTKGDEVVAEFDIPARAVHCACAIRGDARSLGLEVRAGIHAGEVDRRGADVSGIALHIGQRVSGIAEPGEVLVSSTVKELLVGSGISFEDRGLKELRGVPDEWRLFAVQAG
jgi:class 3 adenylate cyclase